MSEEPTTYIIAALSSVLVRCRTLDISSYDPVAFGNFVAKAETSIGRLNIIYDRGFYVEAQQADAAAVEKITEALEQHKRLHTLNGVSVTSSPSA